jgi:hypothetical protein
MKALNFFVATLFFSLLSTSAFAQVIPGNGLYEYKSRNGGGEIEVKNATATGFDFVLNVSQGMQSGSIEEGKTNKKGKVYVYKVVDEEMKMDCELSFDFKGSLLKVIAKNDSCGFGMGITATGVYKFKSD